MVVVGTVFCPDLIFCSRSRVKSIFCFKFLFGLQGSSPFLFSRGYVLVKAISLLFIPYCEFILLKCYVDYYYNILFVIVIIMSIYDIILLLLWYYLFSYCYVYTYIHYGNLVHILKYNIVYNSLALLLSLLVYFIYYYMCCISYYIMFVLCIL